MWGKPGGNSARRRRGWVLYKAIMYKIRESGSVVRGRSESRSRPTSSRRPEEPGPTRSKPSKTTTTAGLRRVVSTATGFFRGPLPFGRGGAEGNREQEGGGRRVRRMG